MVLSIERLVHNVRLTATKYNIILFTTGPLLGIISTLYLSGSETQPTSTNGLRYLVTYLLLFVPYCVAFNEPARLRQLGYKHRWNITMIFSFGIFYTMECVDWSAVMNLWKGTGYIVFVEKCLVLWLMYIVACFGPTWLLTGPKSVDDVVEDSASV